MNGEIMPTISPKVLLDLYLSPYLFFEPTVDDLFFVETFQSNDEFRFALGPDHVDAAELALP